MHPLLTLSLADQRRRDLTADFQARRAGPLPARRLAAPRRAARRGVPRLRVTWSRTTLAAAGRGRSYVIVISATRTLLL